MARMLVVAGDRLHLGGAVVSGSPYTDIDGKAVARMNDPVVCAVHGPGVIASGDVTLIIDGQAVAVTGTRRVAAACYWQGSSGRSQWNMAPQMPTRPSSLRHTRTSTSPAELLRITTPPRQRQRCLI